MELKYQCSKCLDYKNENEFSSNRCYVRGVNYVCKQCYWIKFKSNDKRIICVCGSEILQSSLSRHEKSYKHISYIKENNLN
jgi:hypothetical protein